MELRSRDAYGSVEIQPSGQELYLLRGGFAGLVNRIDDQDLQIRIGADRQRVQPVVDDLDEIWSGLDDTESKTFAPGSGETWIHDPTVPPADGRPAPRRPGGAPLVHRRRPEGVARGGRPARGA